MPWRPTKGTRRATGRIMGVKVWHNRDNRRQPEALRRPGIFLVSIRPTIRRGPCPLRAAANRGHSLTNVMEYWLALRQAHEQMQLFGDSRFSIGSLTKYGQCLAISQYVRSSSYMADRTAQSTFTPLASRQ